jgi:hypothetical protein
LNILWCHKRDVKYYSGGYEFAECHELPKMGEKTIGFVEKAYAFAQKNSNLAPIYLSLDVLGVDFRDIRFNRWSRALAIRRRKT